MLALTVALVAPFFIDWTSYRADFEREASRILGRDVKVEGSATARLLPLPSVTFTDVVVAGVEPGAPAMTIETFSMDAELAPFMRGDLHIFDMRLVRPSVMIDVADDGTLDWTVRPSVPVQASHISLEKLTVTEGKVALRHAASGRTHQLTEINAEIAARALTGPWRMDGSLRVDGLRTIVSASTGAVDDNGAMRLRVRAQPDLYPVALESDGSARVTDGRASYAGQFRLNASNTSDRLRASDGRTVAVSGGEGQQTNAPPAYRLTGAFKLDHAALDVEQFRFETGSLEDPYTADGSARFDLGIEPSFAVRADGAQIRFDDAAGNEAGGGASFEDRFVALRDFMLDLPRPTIPGSIEVALPAIVAGDTTIRDVRLSASPSDAGWNVASLSATLPGRTTLEADGELSLADTIGFNGSLLLAVGQPSGFASWMSRDVDEAIRRLPAAGFSAQVELGEQRQLFRDLELVLGAARFRGEIDSQTPPDIKPSMMLRLAGDSLDVEGMAAFASLFVSQTGQTRLAERDLEFDITAGPVSAAGLTAETLDTALRLKDGQLEIDRLSIGGLSGANISATGSLGDLSGQPTGSVDASIISADLLPLAETLSARFPESALAAEMSRRANLYPGLLEDAAIHVVANASPDGSGTQLTVDASGEAGGTTFDLDASLADWRALPTKTPIVLNLKARNDDAAALYALYGLPGLPFGLAGAAQTELAFNGLIATGGETRFSFSGEGLSLGFEGETARKEAGPTASGTVKLVADDVEPWLAIGGVSLPGFGFGLPVDLESQIDLDEGLLMLSGLSGNVAGEALRGDVNAQMREGLPHLTGALSLSAFDLAMVAEMIVGQAALAGDSVDWPDAPFASTVSPPVTTDIELAAERLGAGTLGEATQARLALRLSRDGLSVSDLHASLYGGTLSGLVDFRNDGGTGIASGQLRLADAQANDVLGNVGIDGKLDLSASLTASGKSVDAIFAGLSGSGTAGLRGLSVSGLNPRAFASLIASADAVGPEIDGAATAGFAPALVRDGRFQADKLDFAFTVANGTARVPPIRIETPEAVLSAELRADLGESTVGADATLTYAPGQEALVGSEPTVRFVAAGRLSDIGVQVDTEPLARFLTQRALELEQQRVEAMQATLLEGQRLRREARYYAALVDQRQRAAEEARRAVEDGERLRREVRAQEEEAARRAAEEQRQRDAEETERLRLEERSRLDALDAERAEAERQRQEEDARLRAQVQELLQMRDPAASIDDDAQPELPDVMTVQPTPRPGLLPEFQAPSAGPSPLGSSSSDGFLRMLFGEE